MKNRVLVIDDMQEVGDIIAQMIETKSLMVDVALNVDQALKYTMENEYLFILCDLSMPQKNGIDFAKAFRQMNQDTPIILMTGWTGNIDEEDAVYFQGTIEKPFDMDELTDKLKALNIL